VIIVYTPEEYAESNEICLVCGGTLTLDIEEAELFCRECD
jgi:hypothetical protein